MKKVMLFFITLVLLTMIGCSDTDIIRHHYVFQGENEDWTVEYEVKAKEFFVKKDGVIQYDSKASQAFSATYKKDPLSLISSGKNIEISYKSSVGAGKSTEELNSSNPKKTFSMKSETRGGAIENKDEVIEVIIDIDGNLQKIELRNE